jgi:hypothetical protein
VIKYLISVSWPKGATRAEGMHSTVELDAADAVTALAEAREKWPEHDVLSVTQAELQPDGRWTFPRDDGAGR